MRPPQQNLAVLEGARLAFVGVADQVALCLGFSRHRPPLDVGREAGTAAPLESAGLDLVEDLCGGHAAGLRQRGVVCRVGSREVDRQGRIVGGDAPEVNGTRDEGAVGLKVDRGAVALSQTAHGFDRDILRSQLGVQGIRAGHLAGQPLADEASLTGLSDQPIERSGSPDVRLGNAGLLRNRTYALLRYAALFLEEVQDGLTPGPLLLHVCSCPFPIVSQGWG